MHISRYVWPGLGLLLEGEWKITVDVFRDLGLAFAGALVAIYVLLVVETRSFFMPLLIMLSIPLGAVGIFPGFWLLNSLGAGKAGGFGNPVWFTATGMIGMIALAGIVIRIGQAPSIAAAAVRRISSRGSRGAYATGITTILRRDPAEGGARVMTQRRIAPEALEDAARVLRAVAHPLRLRLLEVLGQEGEKNVTALCEASASPQPFVSQQLARLRHEGILAARRDGSQVFYRIARPEVLGLLECVRRTARAGRSS